MSISKIKSIVKNNENQYYCQKTAPLLTRNQRVSLNKNQCCTTPTFNGHATRIPNETISHFVVTNRSHSWDKSRDKAKTGTNGTWLIHLHGKAFTKQLLDVHKCIGYVLCSRRGGSQSLWYIFHIYITLGSKVAVNNYFEGILLLCDIVMCIILLENKSFLNAAHEYEPLSIA